MGKHILAGDGTWQPVPLIADPMERMIADALEASGIAYQPEGPATSNLDFRLFNGVHIEVKRLHSPRIAAQMGRVDNVIAAQGSLAVAWLASLIRHDPSIRDTPNGQ